MASRPPDPGCTSISSAGLPWRWTIGRCRKEGGACGRQRRWSSCSRWPRSIACTASRSPLLLWPDRAPAAAANNLHQVLHVARRQLAGGEDAAARRLRLDDDMLSLCSDEPPVGRCRRRSEARAVTALRSGDARRAARGAEEALPAGSFCLRTSTRIGRSPAARRARAPCASDGSRSWRSDGGPPRTDAAQADPSRQPAGQSSRRSSGARPSDRRAGSAACAAEPLVTLSRHRRLRQDATRAWRRPRASASGSATASGSSSWRRSSRAGADRRRRRGRGRPEAGRRLSGADGAGRHGSPPARAADRAGQLRAPRRRPARAWPRRCSCADAQSCRCSPRAASRSRSPGRSCGECPR